MLPSLPDGRECMHRACAAFLAGLDVRARLPSQVHGHERVEVERGLDADSVRVLLAEHGDLRCALGHDQRRQAEEQAQGQCHRISVSINLLFLVASEGAFSLSCMVRPDLGRGTPLLQLSTSPPCTRTVSGDTTTPTIQRAYEWPTEAHALLPSSR